jgi:hypothetical protein
MAGAKVKESSGPYHYYGVRCPDCDDGEPLCNPAYASGVCRTCHGARNLDLPPMLYSFELDPGEDPFPTTGPCPSCNGAGTCSTCGGTGTLDDDVGGDSLVQPY